MFDKKKNSIKTLWSNLGHIRLPNKMHSKSNIIDRLLIDGKEVNHDSEIADSLNEYFASVGQNLSSSVPEVSGSYKDYKDYLGTQISKMKIINLDLK